MFKLSILGLSLFLAGCSSLAPNLSVMNHSTDKATTAKAAAASAKLTEAWNDAPVITEGKASLVLLTPHGLPSEIKNRQVSLELEPDATVKDVVAVLGRLGVTVILADADAAAKKFYLPRFNGSLGTLLSAVTRATDVWFSWQDNAIVVSGTEKIGVTVPQEESFGKMLGEGLVSLGIKDSAVHWQSGMVVLSVAPSQFRQVKTLLERITANAAIVSLQVAVINVTLNQTAKQGIDWESLNLAVLGGGSASDLAKWTAGSSPGSGNNNIISPPVDTDPVAGTLVAKVAAAAVDGAPSMGAARLTGKVLSGAIFNNRFSFEGLYSFLQNYGTAETQQSVLLKTIAGNKVSFKSLTQIPYVSEIGVTTVGNNNSGSALGSSKTDKADDGISVELTPAYDAAANTVTISMDLSIKAVVAFNELSAGSQIGTLTQPTTAERSFTDTLRLRPGQTVVVGGLTYDSVSDSRGAPVFLQGSKFESQALTVSRQSMFIVIRPTVTRLGQVLASESGGDLNFFPRGTLVDETPAKKVEAPKAPIPPKNKASSTKNTEVNKPASELAEMIMLERANAKRQDAAGLNND